MNSRLHIFVVAVLLLLAWHPHARAESVSIAAVVNETVITSTELEERRALALSLNGVELTAENLERASPRVLQSLIEEALQMEEAKRYSITVTDDEIAKAITANEQAKGQPEGSMLALVRKNGLSERSLTAQIRANLAWVRVVQKRLRRNVTVSEDEIARMQQTEAANPGVAEVRIASISVPLQNGNKDAASALAAKITSDIASGTPMGTVALNYKNEGISVSPPRWVAEEKLPAPLAQALRTMKLNETIPPLRTPDSIDILQLMERRTTKPLPEATEVVLKEIALPAPTTPSASGMESFRATAAALQSNPGTCLDTTLNAPAGSGAEAKFVRTTVGALPNELQSLIANLAVGEVSEPLLTPNAIRLVMLCEKIEPTSSVLADADKIRQKLFSEKLELEAAKRLRDLKREAFIDIKGSNGG